MVACHLKSYRPDLGYKMITGKAYKDVVQHLFTCFSYLSLPKVLKTAPLKRRDCLLTLNDSQKLLGDITIEVMPSASLWACSQVLHTPSTAMALSLTAIATL